MRKFVAISVQILIWLSLIAMMCFPVIAHGQTVALTGKFVQPDSSPVNGTITIGLPNGNYKNICTTPFQVVPVKTESYKIINGVMQGIGSANFLSQDCMYPRVPYYITLLDVNNLLLGHDNWYLPRVSGGTIDVGTMGHVGMTTNGGQIITVAIPLAMLLSPTVSQTLTQPSGTSFTIAGVFNMNGPVQFQQEDKGTITWNASGTTTFAAGNSAVAAAQVQTVHSTSTTFSPTGLVKWGQYKAEILQDSTGGGVTFTLGTGGSCSSWKVGGGGSGSITLSSSANTIDILDFTFDGTNCVANFKTNYN